MAWRVEEVLQIKGGDNEILIAVLDQTFTKDMTVLQMQIRGKGAIFWTDMFRRRLEKKGNALVKKVLKKNFK